MQTIVIPNLGTLDSMEDEVTILVILFIYTTQKYSYFVCAVNK